MSQSPNPWEAARRLVGDGMLSIIMPAYNLGEVIEANVREVRELLEGQLPFEIVVVDDGSTDSTGQTLERLARERPEVRPVLLGRNVGKGNALIEGYAQSRGSFVLLLDGDLDLPPEQAAAFFGAMEKDGADIVIGSKRHPDSRLDYPWQRRLASATYFFLVKLLIGLPVHDTQTGIKLYRREALEHAVPQMRVKGFAFDLELLALAHSGRFRIVEYPVELNFKSDALGCFRPTTVWQTLHDTLAIFWRMRMRRGDGR